MSEVDPKALLENMKVSVRMIFHTKVSESSVRSSAIFVCGPITGHG